MNELAQGAEISDVPPITELSKPQRRVIGVLIEKAFTTPEYYPMTLKAITNGCNQKSNRSPVVNYTEDDVMDVLEELRELGLLAVVHTESGRTERFRHYMRKRFPFSEAQLAIMTELLLRGRQSLGELRSRASRMVSIDSLDQLRAELTGLVEQGYLQASGDLARRGVEIDHNMYRAKEGMTLAASTEPVSTGGGGASTPEASVSAPAAQPVATAEPQDHAQFDTLTKQIEELRLENQQLRQESAAIREELQQLSDRFEALRNDLGD